MCRQSRRAVGHICAMWQASWVMPLIHCSGIYGRNVECMYTSGHIVYCSEFNWGIYIYGHSSLISMLEVKGLNKLHLACCSNSLTQWLNHVELIRSTGLISDKSLSTLLNNHQLPKLWYKPTWWWQSSWKLLKIGHCAVYLGQFDTLLTNSDQFFTLVWKLVDFPLVPTKPPMPMTS